MSSGRGEQQAGGRNIKKKEGGGGGLAKRVDSRMGASTALRKATVMSKRRRDDAGGAVPPSITPEELAALVAEVVAGAGKAGGGQCPSLRRLRIALSGDDESVAVHAVSAGCVPALEKYRELPPPPCSPRAMPMAQSRACAGRTARRVLCSRPADLCDDGGSAIHMVLASQKLIASPVDSSHITSPAAQSRTRDPPRTRWRPPGASPTSPLAPPPPSCELVQIPNPKLQTLTLNPQHHQFAAIHPAHSEPRASTNFLPPAHRSEPAAPIPIPAPHIPRPTPQPLQTLKTVPHTLQPPFLCSLLALSLRSSASSASGHWATLPATVLRHARRCDKSPQTQKP